MFGIKIGAYLKNCIEDLFGLAVKINIAIEM